MATTVKVSVQRDHLERLANTRPILGIAELIWNGLDADATSVNVELERGSLGGLQEIRVRDNGHGFTHAEALDSFAQLGGSWKSERSHTKSGTRSMHGHRGEGRFRAFRLGRRIEWITVADVDGRRERTRIVGRRESITDFEVDEPVPVDEQTGTTVLVNPEQENLGSLEASGATTALAEQFAIYLSQYPDIYLIYGGERITLEEVLLRRESLELEDVGETNIQASLTVLEWEPEVSRKLYLCNSRGFAFQELNAGIQAPGFNFTAHVLSDIIEDVGYTDAAVGEMHPVIQPLVFAARQEMRRYFGRRREESRRTRIEDWRNRGLHPYPDPPDTAIEEARRDLFEVVATEIAERVPGFGSVGDEALGLSLRLIGEVAERDSEALRKILNEVLGLNLDEREELAELLDRATLGSILRASRVVSDRLEFCLGLEELVFKPESRRQLLERSQLHRILAEETWLWGEEFSLTVDDESLDRALAAHLDILGREEMSPEPVEVPERQSGILDLMLSRKSQDARGTREHLVVELKRPNINLGSDELTQIERYAYAVAGDERFLSTDTRWTFWLVGNDLKDYAERKANQSDRQYGLVVNEDNLQVWVQKWSQVIDAARRRMKFFQDQLGYAPSSERALEYLRDKHAEYLPDSIRGSEDAAEE